MSNKEERTETATGHKRQEERRKGRIFRNRDVVLAGVFLFEISFIKWNLGSAFSLYQEFYRRMLGQPLPRDFSFLYIQDLCTGVLLLVVKLLGPLMAMIVLFSFSGQLAQGGWNFSTEGFQFNFAKLMPKNNFTRIFSATGFFDLFKSVLMFSIIGFLGWNAIMGLWPSLPTWSFLTPRDSVANALAITYNLAWNLGLAYAVVAALEFLVQRRQFEGGIKMTKQEVKDEHKQMEGNPQVKGKIRQMQYRMARGRMMKDVATASLVVTNPTHFAVALRYEAGAMQAPEVVAKGQGWLALKIRSVAQEHDIPIVENRPLAQLLYKKVEVGEAIPVELYRAVAEILAYLMRAREAFRN
jgi:flagellar biosynthetic protein FlhB